jgi:hypothetical protein
MYTSIYRGRIYISNPNSGVATDRFGEAADCFYCGSKKSVPDLLPTIFDLPLFYQTGIDFLCPICIKKISTSLKEQYKYLIKHINAQYKYYDNNANAADAKGPRG